MAIPTFCARRLFLIAAAIIVTGVVAGCRSGPSRDGSVEEAGPAPNILLYIVDTLRADSVAAYGNPVVETPNVDSFAREGTLFTNAFVQSTWTRASIASILTSTYPGVHAAEGRADVLPGTAVLLSEMLREHGYRTALITANPNIGSFFGFDQGFDDFVELYKRRDAGFVRVAELVATGDVVAQRALEWIAAAEEPFCLVMLSIDPHSPYTPPAEFDRFAGSYQGPVNGTGEWINRQNLSPEEQKRIRSLYYGEIAFNDEAFGSLIAGLRDAEIYDRTMVVYTSDHGEGFWEHGYRGHGRTLHDEELRVPLIVRYPAGFEAGSRIEYAVEAMDITPTVLGLAGVAVPAGLDGRSLLSSEPRELFSSLRHNNLRHVALQQDSWKLIIDLESGDQQLFNRNEPEHRNVAADEPEVVTTLEAHIEERIAANRRQREALHEGGLPGGVTLEDLPQEELDALRSLGYVSEED